MKVLYIEDNVLDAELVRIGMEHHAPEIHLEVAPSFEQGMECLKHYARAWETAKLHGETTPADLPYDLVLTDLKLPDGNGLAVLSHIRSRNLPLAVVIFTGSGDQETVISALRAGADDYVTKRENYVDTLPKTLRAALDHFQTVQVLRTRSLRVLYAEPNAHDVDLTLREIARVAPHIHLEIISTADEVRQRFLNPPVGSTLPDVLLLDYRLPGANAIDLVKELRQARQIDLPIILVTGQGDEEIARQVLKVGAADYVLKSADYLQRLPSILENAHLRTTALHSQNALREEQARLAGIISSAMDAIIVLNANGQVMLFNHAAEQMFGWRHRDALGQRVDRFIPERFRQPDDTSAGPEEPLAGLRANGEEFPIEASVSQVTVNGQKILTVIIRDITERKKAQMTLQRSEERFRALIENASDLITVVDAKGIIRFQSPSCERTLGYTRGEMTGYELNKFIHSEDMPLIRQTLITLMLGEPQSDAVQVRMKHRDETWRHMECIGRKLPDELYGGVIVINSRDHTESRKLEEQFRQSQKMEAIGCLSAGVAHDFNNILTVIQMQASLLQISGQLTPAQLEAAREIEKAGDRAANLTRQLLAFSRRQSMQPRDLDLNQVVANMTGMLQRIVGEDIHVQLHYASQSMLTHADAGMLEQVLLNLVVNARDAMPRGGRLIIKTMPVKLDEAAAAKIPQARPGSFVCLSVRDTGCGIPADLLPRIFEPFFTTKDVGKGTGLGLATVYGIVQQHHGWIDLESVVGHGTTFRIHLSQRVRIPQPAIAEPALASAHGGDETILIVEDEPGLRIVVRTVLNSLGYQVLEASTGRDALKLWAEHRKNIDLLLTDMVMPDGMNGRELADKILLDEPALKVIYTSGYSTEVAGPDFPLDEGINFLGKPFTPLKLAQIIRSRLDG